MARAKTKTVKAGSTTVVAIPQAAPIQRRSRRRSVARRSAPRRHRRRHSGGGGLLGRYGGSSYGSRLVGHGIGGFAVGWIEKTFPSLPSLPFIGRKGAIAAAAYFLHGRHAIIADVGLAAAAISGYELGTSGTITGDVMGGSIASQM